MFGNKCFHVMRTYSEMVVEHFLRHSGPCDIRLDWPVAKIDHGEPFAERLCRKWNTFASVLGFSPEPHLALVRSGVSALVGLAAAATSSRPKITVTCKRGEQLHADKIIVTVPLPILQASFVVLQHDCNGVFRPHE